MCGQEQVSNFTARKSSSDEIAQREEIAERLAHFFAFNEQMCAMQPIFDEPLSGWLEARTLALRNFVFVMREHQILAAEM